MRINTNVSAMTTLRYLNQATDAKSSALTKLSSGSRINSAADDAAGLAVSEKMKAQIGGLEQAKSNAQDGVSLIQTAEGAMSQSQTILDRMRDLAVQSATGTLGNDDRTAINKEFGQLQSELTRISNVTSFNNQDLLKGQKFTFQIGANEGDTLSVTIAGVSSTDLGVSSADITSAGGASSAITTINKAITTVSADRATLGSVQNRLNYAISNLETSDENLSEANSRIRDVDMAQEMTQFTKSNILTQAATSMLAQANAMPNSVLTLLQG